MDRNILTLRLEPKALKYKRLQLFINVVRHGRQWSIAYQIYQKVLGWISVCLIFL